MYLRDNIEYSEKQYLLCIHHHRVWYDDIDYAICSVFEAKTLCCKPKLLNKIQFIHF